VAQTPNPPPASTTNPSAASSPSQREATRSPAAETPAPTADTTDAPTPHQRQAMGGKPQTMKQCMDAQAAKDSGKTHSEMTKACNEQMKMQKDYERLSEAPKNNTDSSRTPAPK